MKPTLGHSKTWARIKGEIQQRGWYQGAALANPWRPDESRVCLLGAVAAVTTDTALPPYDTTGTGTSHEPGTCPSYDIAVAQLAGRLSHEFSLPISNVFEAEGVIAEWNDDPGRSLSDVYALLDELDRAERTEAVQ